jgi:hypothetical protein
LASEVVGWAYHLSNGVSFGLMYAVIVRRAGPVTAVLWGLVLEGVMLLTPYAEVFGYHMDSRFLAITIGAHMVYGLVLWLALRLWRFPVKQPSTRSLALGILGTVLGIALIAVDFHQRYAEALPPSPPPYIGSHLYTTWDVPEPDRLAALWVLKRFVDPAARFYAVPPFSVIKHGRPFDLPEAEIRRQGASSATQVLIAKHGLETNPRLQALADMTHLAEVTPWMLLAHPDAQDLAQALRQVSAEACGQVLSANCLEPIFAFLDAWYNHPGP